VRDNESWAAGAAGFARASCGLRLALLFFFGLDATLFLRCQLGAASSAAIAC